MIAPAVRALRSANGALGSGAFIVVLDVLAFAVFAAAAPAFATADNLQNVLVSSLPLLLVATGQTFVLVAGGIDLSAPAIVGLASISGALVMSADVGLLAANPLAPAAGATVMLAVGLLAGAGNGACVAWLRMPPFMVTLTAAMFGTGVAVWATRAASGTETIYNLPAGFLAVGTTWAAATLAIFATVGAHVLLERTLAGRWVRAVGHNARAARVAGVPVEGTTVLCYALSGLSASLAAVLLTARLETAAPTHGRQLLLDVIGAAVIGGTSLFGGIGTIRWTVFGVLFLAMLSNGLTLLDLSDFVITIIKGCVILVAALLDVWRARWFR